MNDCQNFANDVALAFQQIFDIGGWNAVIWIIVGWILAGGPFSIINWFERRRAH